MEIASLKKKIVSNLYFFNENVILIMLLFCFQANYFKFDGCGYCQASSRPTYVNSKTVKKGQKVTSAEEKDQ